MRNLLSPSVLEDVLEVLAQIIATQLSILARHGSANSMPLPSAGNAIMSDAGGAAASSLGRDILQVAKAREDSGGKIKISPLIESLAEFHRLTSDYRVT